MQFRSLHKNFAQLQKQQPKRGQSVLIQSEREGDGGKVQKYPEAVMGLIFVCLSSLYYLMSKQARFEMVNRVINENKGKLNLHELQNRFGSRLTSKMIRKYEFTNNKFLKKYSAIERRYEKGVNKGCNDEWLENQRKLFIWFSIIFCNYLRLPFEELTQQHWATLSFLFFGKNTLLLQYETKQIQRNPHRVSWAKREQTILLQAVNNGKLSQWNDISKRIFFETAGKYYKTSKQCREHWFNHLDKTKKKGEWTTTQDLLLLETVKNEGRKWSTITHLLSQKRTQHMVKNRYNSLIKGNLKTEQSELSEESILDRLIAKLQVEAPEEGIEEVKEVNEEERSEEVQEGQGLKLEEDGQLDANQSIIEAIVQEQSSSEQQIDAHVNSRARSEPNPESVGQPWSGSINNQSLHSPYFFVFSPFSFSSTASPYVNPYPSWSNWTPAHETLFFNPQCTPQDSLQPITSPSFLQMKPQ